MLFIFGEDVNYAFWMKDCLIPLDMIFIDADKNIVDIIQYATPCLEEDEDDCLLYGGNSDYRYVIEMNAGQTNKNNIQIGDKVLIDI